MYINIKKIAEELEINRSDLIARLNGRLIYQKALKIIENINRGETVILDFQGIRVVDSSFIDEFIINLIKRSIDSSKDFYIKLKNLSKTIEINIDSVLNTYFNYNNEKIAVLTEEICLNNNFFIGPLNDIEKDIINYLRVNRSGALSDLEDFTGLNRGILKETMDFLCKIKLVKKDRKDLFSSL